MVFVSGVEKGLTLDPKYAHIVCVFRFRNYQSVYLSLSLIQFIDLNLHSLISVSEFGGWSCMRKSNWNYVVVNSSPIKVDFSFLY